MIFYNDHGHGHAHGHLHDHEVQMSWNFNYENKFRFKVFNFKIFTDGKMCSKTSPSRVPIAKEFSTNTKGLIPLRFFWRFSNVLNTKTLKIDRAQVTIIVTIPYQ